MILEKQSAGEATAITTWATRQDIYFIGITTEVRSE